MKNANILYERLKNKGNIAQRAYKILTEGKKVNKLGRPYSLRYVYVLAKTPGVDQQVDLAIIQASEQYLDEIEARKVEVSEKEKHVLDRVSALFD